MQPGHIACDLAALTASERSRRAELADSLRANVVGIVPLADGFELRLHAPAFATLPVAEWIVLERRCCPFLRFAVVLEPDEDWVRIALTGGPGVKEFLATAGLAAPASC